MTVDGSGLALLFAFSHQRLQRSTEADDLCHSSLLIHHHWRFTMMSKSNNSYGSIPSTGHYNDDAEVSETVRHFGKKLERFTGRALLVTATLLVVLLVHACYVSRSNDHRYDNAHPIMMGMSHEQSYLLDPSLDERELFYNEQYLDHIYVDTEHSSNIKTWPQRFYKKSKYWKKGGPILLVIGGEDSLDLPLLYPFVHEGLAKEFGAFFISPEVSIPCSL